MVLQLLRDWKNVWQGGMQEAYVETTDDNPPSARGYHPFSRAYDERYFEDTFEAESFESFEAVWETLRNRRPRLAGVLDSIYARSTAGDKDVDRVREKAEAGDQDAMTDMLLHDWAVDILVFMLRLRGQEVTATLPLRRSRMATDVMEANNARVIADYQELMSEGYSKKEARSQVLFRYGISERTMARIEANRREDMGLEKRKPGRPRK